MGLGLDFGGSWMHRVACSPIDPPTHLGPAIIGSGFGVWMDWTTSICSLYIGPHYLKVHVGNLVDN
jgi:hypothetical protein